MTVQRCARTRVGWSGSGTITGGNNYRVTYIVQTDDKDDGPVTIVTQSLVTGPHPIPQQMTTYSVGNDSDYTVVHKRRSSRKLKDIATGALWQIDCDYERPGTQELSDLEVPHKRPTKYRLEWAQFTYEANYDIQGTPILNTANQPYIDPIMIDDARPVFVAEKNISSLGTVLALAATYRNAVNSDVFYGSAPRHAKVESITCGEMETEWGVGFFPTVFRIQIKDSPWDVYKKEEGYAHFSNVPDGIPDRLQVATDFAATGFAEPILLTHDGEQANILQDPIYTPWRVYPERTFSGLGI